MIIENTKEDTQNNPENFNVADYWNIAIAFISLQEDKEKFLTAIRKGIENDADSFCNYSKSMGNSKVEMLLKANFTDFYTECTGKETNLSSSIYDTEYCIENAKDCELIAILHEIELKDQKYRFDKEIDWEKQHVLDASNQKSVDSLFSIYKKYIGRELTGEKYEDVMWSVIQHSNIKIMEKYLPEVQKAYLNNDIDVLHFKALIDRVYAIKFGFQIFGSQGGGLGVEVANDSIRNQVIKKYKIRDTDY